MKIGANVFFYCVVTVLVLMSELVLPAQLKPFTGSMWSWLGVLVVSVTIALLLTIGYAKYIEKKDNEPNPH